MRMEAELNRSTIFGIGTMVDGLAKVCVVAGISSGGNPCKRAVKSQLNGVENGGLSSTI